ncbi:restriction endonuclease [Streptomyces parvus]|uniref:restriction endonuclease n=1 Tax=Streptomyces parvus TaxID=66428 RepID=UPI00210070F2|nr:restriction endonuclease [Streptomyces parvus]MCQ1579345.1 restriction endonuclease [Streptomyces parvus]
MSLLEPSADAVRPSPESAVRCFLESARERATSVDLEAAFAWVAEGRLADDLVADWRRLGEEAQAELSRCWKGRGLLEDGTVDQDTVRYGRWAAAKIFRDELHELVSLAGKAVEWCEEVRDGVIKDLGRLVRERRTEFPSAKAAPLGELLEELQRARARYVCSLEAYRRELEELSAEERQRQAFRLSSASTSLEEIRRLSSQGFELLIAQLLERDGYEVQRMHGGAGDRGADVIATGGNGERIVVQCKLRRAPSAAIGAPDVQAFNGTARPDHDATHPIMVTNTRFTVHAERAAARYGIALVDSTALRAWATFGKPLELT